MKKLKILIVSFLVVLLFASCGTEQNTNGTESPTTAQKPTAVPDGTEQNTKGTESPTDEQNPVATNVALILDDYDDYLLYREGKLDVEDYYYGWYGTDPKVFVDVRSLLNLPSLPVSGYKERITISSNKEFIYYIYSVDDQGKTVKTEFTAIVSYEADRANDVPNTPSFDSIKANTKNEPYFNIRKGKNTIAYSQNNQKYFSFSVYLEDYRLSFSFGSDGLTPEQIEEKCGKLVASFVSENDEELSRGVETIAHALGQAS